MLTELDARPAQRTHSTGTRRVLAVQLTDAPDALVRVLTTLRRRRCEITHVDYLARDRHHPGRLVIGLEPPRGRAHCVEGWVRSLVDVLAVESL